MASQGTPIFIQACENKVYGNKIWINLNTIVSFARDKQYSIDEGQWYKVIMTDGSINFTTYNLQALNIYNLPAF